MMNSIHAESRLPEGVICLPLAEALVAHGDLVAAHFMRQETRLGSAKFAALHEASVSNGLFVHTGDHVGDRGHHRSPSLDLRCRTPSSSRTRWSSPEAARKSA